VTFSSFKSHSGFGVKSGLAGAMLLSKGETYGPLTVIWQ
jgi:hypothetical protein